MRKLVILVFFLLAAALSSAPLIVGYQFKRSCLGIISALNESNKDFQVSVLEYHLGWLHSSAKIQLQTQVFVLDSDSKTPSKVPLIIVIDNQIAHGPLIQAQGGQTYAFALANIKSSLHVTSPKSMSVAKDTSVINTQVDFNHHWVGQLTEGKAAMPLGDFAKLSIENFKSDFSFNTKKSLIDEFKLNFELNTLLVAAVASNTSSPLQELSIDTIKYEHHGNQQALGLWTGDTKISIPNIIAKKSDKTTIAFNALTIDTSINNPVNDLYSFNLRLGLNHLQTAQELVPTLGPVLLSFAANNLSGSGLQDLGTFFKEHNGPLSNEDRITYLGLVPKIFTATTTISEDLNADTALGNFKNDARVSFKAAPANLQELSESANSQVNLRVATVLVDKLIAAYDGPAPSTTESQPVPQTSTIKPSVPATAAAAVTTPPPPTPTTSSKPTARQILDSWLQRGLVIREGNDYLVSIKYENGATTINGKIPGQ